MGRSGYPIAWRAFCVVAGMFASGQAPVETEPPAKKWAPTLVPKSTAPAQPQVAMPGVDKIVLLVRSTLLTLNDALQTGNYTVLRDVGAPAFREANTAAKLSQIFAPLAAQGVDLFAVTVLAPQLTEAPTIEPQRQM